ncbi:MAG: hypothetical protein ABH879_05230 [archaeon]
MAHEKAAPALILGIISIPAFLLPLIGLPVAIVGIILGIRGVQNSRRFALAGLICAIIGLALTAANAAIGAYIGVTGQLY